MSSGIRKEIHSILEKSGSELSVKVGAWLAIRDPVAFRAAELEIAEMGRDVADAVTALVLKHLVGDPELQAQASVEARQEGHLRHGGTREVGVTLLGGSEVRLNVEYVRPNRRGLPGRPRKVGKRGKGGAGFYPVLAMLGVWFGVTPALGGEVCRQVADSDSLRAGRAALARRGN